MKRFSFPSIFSKTTSIIIGVVFIVVGLLMFTRFDPDAYDVKATGTIVEIEEYYDYTGDKMQLAHTVYIDYSAGDTKYEHVEFVEYNHKMKVGDEVEFYYMSDDPTQIAGTDKEYTPYYGLGFAAIGLIVLAVTVIKIFRRVPM